MIDDYFKIYLNFKYSIEELAFGVEERLLYLVHEVTTRFYWDAFMGFKLLSHELLFQWVSGFSKQYYFTHMTFFYNFAQVCLHDVIFTKMNKK